MKSQLGREKLLADIDRAITIVNAARVVITDADWDFDDDMEVKRLKIAEFLLKNVGEKICLPSQNPAEHQF